MRISKRDSALGQTSPDLIPLSPASLISPPNFLFLLEAVTSHGPVTPKRVEELEVTLKDCVATQLYVSAFPDFRQFKQHVDKIAWETEVWIAEIPDHLIHFNGDKFLGPKQDT